MKQHYQIPASMLFAGVICLFASSFATSTALSDILTQDAWTSYEIWTDEDGDGVFIQTTEDCESDNSWAFSTDQTFVIDENDLMCLPESPELDTISGNWVVGAQDIYLGLFLANGAVELYFQVYAVGQNEIILDLVDPENLNAPPSERVVLRR